MIYEVWQAEHDDGCVHPVKLLKAFPSRHSAMKFAAELRRRDIDVAGRAGTRFTWLSHLRLADGCIAYGERDEVGSWRSAIPT